MQKNIPAESVSHGSRVAYYVVAALLFVLIAASATFKINDPDTIYYLAHGKHILHHGFQSYSMFVYPIANGSICYPEWLFHVMTYGVYALGGYNGLVILQILLVMAIFFIVVKNSIDSKFSFLSTALCVFFAVIVGMERFMLRADTFGLLAAVAFYYALARCLDRGFRTQQQSPARYAASLLFIQALWANTHTSFPLGFILIGAFLGHELVNPLVEGFAQKKRVVFATRKIKFLFLLLPAAIAASCINPYGFKSFLWPFRFLFGESLMYSQLEWASPFQANDLQQLSVVAYKILFFAALGILALNVKRIKLIDIFILAPFFYLSARFVRNLGLFAFFIALILPPYIDAAAAKIPVRRKMASDLRLVLCLVLAFFSVVFAARIITNDMYLRDQRSRRFGFGSSELMFPVGATDFILQNNLKGRLFNDYGTGTYVNWRLFPRYQSFIDGHSYTAELLDYYNKVVTGITPYQDVVDRFGVNFFLLNHTFKDTPQLIAALYKDKKWVPVYFDELCVIFIADKPENKDIIKKYAIDFSADKNFDPNRLTVIKDKVNYSIGWSNRGVFFSTIGLLPKAGVAFEKAVEADPKNFTAYNNLGSIYTQLFRDDEALKAYQTSLAVNPDFAVTHYNLALLYQKTTRYQEAIAEYERALAINPELSSAQDSLAKLKQLNQGSLAQLQASPEETTKGEPLSQQPIASASGSESANKHFAQAIAYGQKGDHMKAIEEFKKAVEADSRFTLAYLNLGNAYSLKNMPEEARLAYEKALELDDTLALAHLNLGVIYRYQKHNPILALQHWERYIQLAPTDPETRQIRLEVENIKKQLAAGLVGQKK